MIFNGDAIPILATDWLELRFNHTLAQSRNNVAVPGSQDIVFAGTTGYYVEWRRPGNG